MARRRGLGAGYGVRSGGTEYPGAKPSPKPSATGLEGPPVLSFDPSIEAQRREAQRGLEDTEADITTKEHFGHQDLTSALKDIHTKTSQSRQDINRSANRAQEKLGYQEQDQNKNAARANQDFNTSLQNIARQFGQLGHRQAEAANAAGVGDQGTLAAGAAARAQNQALAESPIHTAQQRSGEDLATALGRIGTARQQATTDQGTALGRLTLARNRERTEAKRATGRKDFEYGREGQRAKREEQFKNADLIAEEVYAARQEHPAVFKQWLQEHPKAMAKAKQSAQGGKGKKK